MHVHLTEEKISSPVLSPVSSAHARSCCKLGAAFQESHGTTAPEVISMKCILWNCEGYRGCLLPMRGEEILRGFIFILVM